MTNKEKKNRKAIRQELRAMGLLPERKNPLNRKKFTDEVRNEYLCLNYPLKEISLITAFSLMIPTDIQRKITAEEIGILKVIKAAMEIDKLEDYDIGKIYDEIIKPIREL